MKISENEKIIDAKAKIETCLQKGDYSSLDNFLNSEETRELLGKDQELYIVGILSEVNKIETKNGICKGILYGRTLKDSVFVYKEVVLLLRRLEFDLPKEYQKELINYIYDNEISVIAVWAIIQGTKYLYAKEIIVERFKKLF